MTLPKYSPSAARARPAVLAAFVALSAASPALADASYVDPDGHLSLELIGETQAVRPGQTFWVALRQRIAPGWHTYWRNPGQGGQATTLAWTLPSGWTAGPIVWPTPQRYALGPYINYVYSGEVVLPVQVRAPDTPRSGPVTLHAHATYLVCRDVCIPGRAELDLPIRVGTGAPAADPQAGAAIHAVLDQVARRPLVHATYALRGNSFTIALPGVGSDAAAPAYFYPADPDLIDSGKPETASGRQEGLVLQASAADPSARPAREVEGVLSLGGRDYEVAAKPGALPAWAAAGPAARPGAASEGSGLQLASAALLAFLGGVILNLMPCVFPILSMKAAALTRHGGEPGRARREALAFLAGSLAAFLVLAGCLVLARSAGAQIGWGFQLQSPAVVVALTLVMLLAGLNLSGVFEAGLVLQGVQAPKRAQTGLAGAFATGALAAVVAAPCTAPLMGPAVGWSLTQVPAVSLAIFAALGAGLAAPFVVLSFIPALVRRLPRPGPWLDHFRKALAFPMYGAAGWLAWVLALQTGGSGLPGLFAAALATAVAAWAWGVSQRASRAVAWRAAAVAALLLAAPLGAAAVASPRAGASAEQASAIAAPSAERWSPEKVAAAQAQGRPVFVDFSAAWCVTCQVNERVALSTAEVARAFQRTGAVYLKADWTSADPQITAALAAHGRSGVPLYLVYGRAPDPEILPQILTPDRVAKALDAARSTMAGPT